MAEGKKDRGFVLGDISPLAGMISGEGLASNLNPIRLMANLKSGNMRGMGGDEEEEMVAVKKGPGMKRGGKVGGVMKGGDMPFFASKAGDRMAPKKKPARKPKTSYASGGMVKGDGCAMRGKTRGKLR
jgi:hypothetical protein